MKLTVNTKALAKELEFIEKPLKLFIPNPVFKFVLFEASGNVLKLTTSNGLSLLTSTTLTLDEEVAEPIVFVVPGDRLKDMVKLLDMEKVSFSITDKTITMTAGKAKYRFNTNPLAIDHIKSHLSLTADGPTFTCEGSKFVDALKVASNFSAKSEQSQYTLNGVELVANETSITGRASDGHRAAEMILEDKNEGRNGQVFLMRDGISAVADIVPKDSNAVLTIMKGESRYRFECANRRVDVQRQTVEKFPPIDMVFAKCEANETFATVDAKQFSLAVQRMQTAAAGSFNKIIITIEEGKISLQMAGFGDAISEANEEVLAKTNGTGKCSLNVGYVLDYSKLVAGEIDIRIGAGGPALFKHGMGLRCMILQMA